MWQGQRWLLIVVLVLLTGCAAKGPRYAEVEGSFPSIKAGQGRLVVYRPAGLGAGVQPEVKLNGETIGKPEPEGFFFVDRAAGLYTVSARTEVEASVDVELIDGRTTYVQFGITMGLFVGHPRLSVQSESMALPQLSALAYTGAVPVVPGPARPRQASSIPTGPGSGSARPYQPVTLDDLRGLLPPR